MVQVGSFQAPPGIYVYLYIYIYIYICIYLEPFHNPFGLEFRLCFEGLTFKNTGHLGKIQDVITFSPIKRKRRLYMGVSLNGGTPKTP